MCKDVGPQRKRNVTTDVKKQNNRGGIWLNTATHKQAEKACFYFPSETPGRLLRTDVGHMIGEVPYF